jgi:hypothetical protein
MFHRLDKDGFYVGVSSDENQEWEFQTEIDFPNDFVKPKLVKSVWIETYVSEPEKEQPPAEILQFLQVIKERYNI